MAPKYNLLKQQINLQNHHPDNLAREKYNLSPPLFAANGANNEWLAVWQQELSGGSGYAIKGFRWGSDPTVIPHFFDVANFAFWENQNPAVAANHPDYFIAYEGDSSTTNRHIYGRVWWPEAGSVYLPLTMRP